MTRNHTAFAVGLLLAATLSWGGMFPVSKPALHLIDPYYLTAIRYGSAAVLFALILAAVEGRRAFVSRAAWARRSCWARWDSRASICWPLPAWRTPARSMARSLSP